MNNGFVDLHCHMLYDTDDGATSEQEMYDMLDMAYQDGTRQICLTPHANFLTEDHDPENAEIAFEKLSLYAKKYPDLKLYRGNEIFFAHGVLEALREGEFLSLNSTRYVLVEFLPTVSFYDIGFGLKQLMGAGYFPIIAHVERYACLYRRPEALIDWARNDGVYFQVNGSSLLGKWGRRAKRFAKKALRSGTVVAVASDAHGATHRTPCLSDAYQAVVKEVGPDMAKQLFYDLPLAVLSGQRLSY